MKFLPAVSIALVLGTLAKQTQSQVREDQSVLVNSILEHWLLQWQAPPQPVCSPEDPNWSTCPCHGFAFGEMGHLDLVRKRPRHSDETFPLTPLFAYGEFPSLQRDGDAAALQRWPVLNTDNYEDHSVAFAQQVRKRPPAKVIQLGDYDHDGNATEFLLLVASGPCGHNGAILVGISRNRPSIHAFSSIAHPERPLILDTHFWKELLPSQGRIESSQIRCGDHGAEEQTDVRLVVSARGIDATRLTYDCTPRGDRGSLRSTEAF